MSSRKFYSDLAIAKQNSFGNISRVRRGELEDGIAFTYSHAALPAAVDIELVIQDVAEYTHNASFMLIASPENDQTSRIEQTLEALARRIRSKSTIGEALEFISSRLSAALVDEDDMALASENASSDNDDIDDDDDDDEVDSDADNGFFGEDHLDAGSENQYPGDPKESRWASQECRHLELLKQALKKAQFAGLFVGLLPAERGRIPRYVSLSVETSCLGLPEDVLEAWGLQPTDHLVLLVYFASSFPTLATYLGLPEEQIDVQFRFGKCAQSKPSLEAARSAFFGTSDVEVPTGGASATRDGEIGPAAFLPTHMSASINWQLNRSLHRLLALRRHHNASWKTAQEMLCHLKTQKPVEISSMDVDDGPMIGARVPGALQADNAMEPEDQVSLPLVAMQLSLRQLARCTEFCMACQLSLGGDVGSGSLKPYVCERPLCLYQYVSLGFGPSIEHEIIDNPYVVDLLVCFLYAALQKGKLREFPSGLVVKVPDPNDAIRGTVVDINPGSSLIKVRPQNESSRHILRPGDWLLIAKLTLGTIAQQGVTFFICRLEDSQGEETFQFSEVAGPFSSFGGTADKSVTKRVAAIGGMQAEPNWAPAVIMPFTHDLQSVPEARRMTSLALLVMCIPSVLEMRELLLRHPGAELSSMDKLNRSAVLVLIWILASNRSHIVQDEPLPLVSTAANEGHQGSKAKSLKASPSGGLEESAPGYAKFRFVQGSPDKELRFTWELHKRLKEMQGQETATPALFAWHGSAMHNWHSIVRTGLDFQTKVNGRTFGNGVYLSRQMEISRLYTTVGDRREFSNWIALPVIWANSELTPSTALSLCEVINRPKEFVSIAPHYVVDRLDWIQCRYLYVSVNPTDRAMRVSFPGRTPKPCPRYVPQEPNWHLLGMKNRPLLVPADAIPPARYRRLQSFEGVTSTGDSKEVKQHNGDAIVMAGDDLELLNPLKKEANACQSGAEEQTSCSSDSRRNGSTKMPADATGATEKPMAGNTVSSRPAGAGSVTDYQPGCLDHTALPRLPAPSWASSSPHALHALNREVKDLHKVQSRVASAERGWTIDVEKIDNLFHWIVEMHSFDITLPLAQDMIRLDVASIVLEVRFGANFPLSPPFVRVVRPRFLPFAHGGGGHVTAGGAICSELLTNSGWSPALSMEKVLLQVRLGLCELDPAARLHPRMHNVDYGIAEAAEAYRRAAAAHGWQVSTDLQGIASMAWS